MKFTYSELATVLRETSKVSLETKGSYSYATGVYEYMLADLVANLPERRQAEFVRALLSAQKSMQESA